MQRKIFTLLLTVVMLALTVASPIISTEAATSTTNAQKVIDAIGIMKTDKVSSSKGTAAVTRAEFAQMLINMSSYKGKVTGDSNVSLYSDVSKKYWAAGYIKVAVSQGWMSGYLDGSFKPSKGVTLAQAVNGVLKLLGYTNSDFTGNITTAEMALYEDKELNENISKTKNQVLTRNDCINLFYNTLTATTKEGKIYATSLGYTVDANGDIDYLSLVNSKLKGPILADDNWKTKIPFSLSTATFYKDGTLGTLSDIQKNDVIYYSTDLKSVWAYDNKVTGTIQSINPDRLAPTSVTVGGTEYTLGSNAMSVEFSSLGSYDEGDVVTLILGKDDTVVDVLDIDESNVTITGIVIDTGEHVITNADDELETTYYMTYVDANGNEYEQDYDITNYTYSEGDLVRVSYVGGIATVSRYTLGSAVFGNNTFSSDGTKLGDYDLSANVKIIDYYEGNYAEINPKRLADVKLGSGSVCYYELNSSGDVSQLILYNVTGDVYKYGILTGIESQASSDVMNYGYIIDGKSGTGTADYMEVEVGPKGFVFDDDDSSKIEDITELTKFTVKSVGTTTISDTKQKYQLADEVAVYYLKSGSYSATTLSEVSNLKKYKLTAYYDKSASTGGRVRVIVAENID